MSLDDKSLSNAGKVEIPVEFGCGPNLSGFYTSVVRRGMVNKIWFPPVLKIQLNVLKKSGLIPFCSEVIMCLAVLDQIFGYFALSQ